MTGISRPDYNGSTIPTIKLAPAVEEAPAARASRTLTIKPRTKSISLRTGTYEVAAKVFQTDIPFDGEEYLFDELGLFVAVMDEKDGDSYVFFPMSVISSMLKSEDKPKKKEVLAFANDHYDVFSQIIADMNTKSRDYSWTKVPSLPFVDDEGCVETSETGARAYFYDRF